MSGKDSFVKEQESYVFKKFIYVGIYLSETYNVSQRFDSSSTGEGGGGGGKGGGGGGTWEGEGESSPVSVVAQTPQD